MPHPFFDRDRPRVIGHRGAAGTHPENTLASFAAALAQGAQILESDVHLTRDGVPILLHDPEVDRVTESQRAASALSWHAIRRLDAGHHFHPTEAAAGDDRFRGQGHRIPSLEEAFERFPTARFNLEIKCSSKEAIRATLDLVERFERADRTLLAAGEDEIMRKLRRQLSERAVKPALGASLAEIVASIRSALDGTPMPPGVMALQIPPDFAGNPLVTPALVDYAHAHDVEVHVWTINSLDEIERLLALGVDGIVTDFPGRMADWLVSRERS